jgi:hypothetical protein
MASKERVTLVMATNSTGTCKIPITMISKAARPMCFREGVACPIPYYSQKNAWMDTSICQRWFSEVFVPEVKKFTNRPVLLLWDGATTHSILNNDHQFKILKLPPNTTSRLQPLDQGIISALKRAYRILLVSKLISLIDNWSALQQSAKLLKRGCSGIQQACDPNLLDVALMLESCWRDVTCETIINCFLKAGVLPATQHSQLQALSIKATMKQELDSHLHSLSEVIRRGPTNLPCDAPESVVAMCDIPLNCVSKVVTAWFDLEKNESMMMHLIDDAQ